MKTWTLWLRRGPALAILLALMVACAPAATPAPTPIPKAPAAPATSQPAPAATPTAPPAAAATPTAKPAAPPAATATARPATKVRFGHTGLVSDAGVFIGAAKGYFKDQGIDVELTQFARTADIIPALGTGQIEVAGSSNTPSLYNAIMRGVPLKIVADKSACPGPGWGSRGLMIRSDLLDSGQYKGIKDLKGKTIAIVGQWVFDDYMLDILLNKEGMSLNDVKLTILDGPSMIAALANKSIDGLAYGEPTMAEILEKKLARWVVSCDQVLPDAQSAQIIYPPHFYKDTDVSNRFMVGYVKGLRDYNDAFGPKKKGLDEVVRILTTNTAIKDPASYAKMVPAGLNPDGYVNVDGYNRILEWFVKNKALEKMPDIKSIVDHQYVDYAVKTLGKYQ